uniref:Uncharacterized protein n=1 Tax=Cacopsylla melanoneura TaxID=428564 RepID=A0A8D8R3L4_9HEMI
MVMDTRKTVRSNIFGPTDSFLPHDDFNDHFLEIKTNFSKLKSKYCQKCDLTNLTHNISELFVEINKKCNDNNKHRTKINALNKQLETFKIESEAIKLKMTNENDRVNTIISENKLHTDQFQHSLKTKDNEIKDLKQKYNILELKNEELTREKEVLLQNRSDKVKIQNLQENITRIDKERQILTQKNESLIQEKIELIKKNSAHVKTIEELRAELGGAQFTIDTLRTTFDIQCINYDDDDGNDCTTFIQFSHQESYGTSLLQELNEGSIINLEEITDYSNNTSNIQDESTATCVPNTPAEDNDTSSIDTPIIQEESNETYVSPAVTILNHEIDISISLEPRPVTYEEVMAYDEYWRKEEEKAFRAQQTTTTPNVKKPAAAIKSASGRTTTRRDLETASIAPNVTFDQNNKNVYLIGDSIAKSIVQNLANKCPSSYDLIDYSRGGMTIINASKEFVDEPGVGDIAVLLVGTNDLFKTQWEDMKKAFINLLEKLKNCKQIYVSQILRRYDIKKINIHIARLNTCLKHLVKSYNNVKIINTNLIKYHHLSHDKLHLNNAGKNVLTYLLASELFPKPTDTSPDRNTITENNDKNTEKTRKHENRNIAKPIHTQYQSNIKHSSGSERFNNRSGVVGDNDNRDRGRWPVNQRYTGYHSYYNRKESRYVNTPSHHYNKPHTQHPHSHSHSTCTTCSCREISYNTQNSTYRYRKDFNNTSYDKYLKSNHTFSTRIFSNRGNIGKAHPF